jgi:hypothetical protein
MSNFDRMQKVIVAQQQALDYPAEEEGGKREEPRTEAETEQAIPDAQTQEGEVSAATKPTVPKPSDQRY